MDYLKKFRSIKHLSYSLILLIWIYYPAVNAENLLINEFLASNKTGIVDWENDASDWLEILNMDSIQYQLQNFTLTDKPDNPAKWIFPDDTIQPGEYLIIWASGKDKVVGNEMHTNFKLSKSGEFIGLYNSSGAPTDTFSYNVQIEDVSFGRYPDSESTWLSFSNPSPGEANQIALFLTVDQPNGVYNSNVMVTMTTNVEGGEIRYTQSGDIPKKWGYLYTGPITFWKTTAMRAVVFLGDSMVVPEQYRIYIINEYPQLPVLSFIMEPSDLWGKYSGIYQNPTRSGINWERHVQVIYYKDGETKFSVPAGIRIHGQGSRTRPKKRFRLYFRNEYGMSRLEYPIFKNSTITEYKRLVIHSDIFADILTHDTYRSFNGYISDYTPVALYLNKDYWGIYWIRERIDKYYIEDYFSLTDIDLNRSEWRDPWLDVREGDRIFWDQTMNYFNTHNLQDTINFNYVNSNLLYLDNYTDYYIMSIFAARYDWPHTNIDRFRDRSGEDPRWYHILWDSDEAWKYPPTRQTLEWVLRSEVRTDLQSFDSKYLLWSTLYIRKLLENNDYKYHFVNRFCDLMNSDLSFDTLNTHITQLKLLIENETPREWARWDSSYANSAYARSFSRYIKYFRDFCWGRPIEIRKQLATHFSLNGTQSVGLLPNEGDGQVKINTIIPDSIPWSGIYFQDIPITLTALPDIGQKFKAWSDSSLPETASITFNLTQDIDIYAIFGERITIDTIIVNSMTDSSAEIHLTTTGNSNVLLQYGIDSTQMILNKISTIDTTSHSFTLDSLLANQTYYYSLQAWDMENDTIQSPIGTFQTLPSHPIIMNVSIDSISRSEARLNCTTNEPTSMRYYFGPDTTAMSANIPNILIDTNHTVSISHLSDTTQYFIKFFCTNQFGLSTQSSIFSFYTLADHESPIITGIQTGNITDSSATFSCRTSEISTGNLYYGLSDSLMQIMAVSYDSLFRYTANISGLSHDTTYYFQFHICDQNNNCIWTPLDSFVTLYDSTSIIQPDSSDTIKTNINFISNNIPESFEVFPNYPNPFNQMTTFKIMIPVSGFLRIHIYSITGQLVNILSENQISPGNHQFQWSGINRMYNNVSSGIYLLRIEFRTGKNRHRITHKIILQK